MSNRKLKQKKKIEKMTKKYNTQLNTEITSTWLTQKIKSQNKTVINDVYWQICLCATQLYGPILTIVDSAHVNYTFE